jgi:hypothetical protein
MRAEPISIEVDLSLEHTSAAEVVAVLTFANQGVDTAYLWRPIAMLDGRMKAARFVVTADGRPVAYTGRMAKIGGPKPEDFEHLTPGATVTARIPLNQGYKLPDQGRLSVRYEAYNPSRDGENITLLSSNEAVMNLP